MRTIHKCRFCQADIVWLRTKKYGQVRSKPVPVEPESCRLDEITSEWTEDMREFDPTRHINHLKNCKNPPPEVINRPVPQPDTRLTELWQKALTEKVSDKRIDSMLDDTECQTVAKFFYYYQEFVGQVPFPCSIRTLCGVMGVPRENTLPIRCLARLKDEGIIEKVGVEQLTKWKTGANLYRFNYEQPQEPT